MSSRLLFFFSASPAWPFGRGFVTADMIKQNIPFAPAADTLFFLCGPGMCFQQKPVSYNDEI
jgi:hypothetical protein